MPRLQGLEDRGINIQRLAVPETAKKQFAWNPEKYITPTKWDELLRYVEGKLMVNDPRTQLEAIGSASAMCTLFRDRRDQVHVPRSICENFINSYAQGAENVLPEDQRKEGLLLIRFLAKVRPLFPDLVASAMARYNGLINKGRDYIVDRSLTTPKEESWQDAINFTLATGDHFNISRLRWTIHDLIQESQAKMREPEWWTSAKALDFCGRVALPVWVYYPQRINEIRPDTQAWAAISSVLLKKSTDSRFPYAFLDELLRLTLLAADDVRADRDGIHFVLPDKEEEGVQSKETPPARRSF